MAIHWTIPCFLLFSLIIVQARPPGLYWPSQEDHNLQPRTHIDENALSGLSENELETMLYLLDKVERPKVTPIRRQHSTYSADPYDRRRKRTGGTHHSEPQKKAVDWSNYFGVDKREVKEGEIGDLIPTMSPRPDAKDDKERENILKEFYSNMAMAGNIKRRKRSIRNKNSGDRVEKDLAKVGDNLIWEALKLTGSHRDEKMNKEEFKQFKKELMHRIGAAYDLEKLRQVFEGNSNKFSGNKNHIGQ